MALLCIENLSVSVHGQPIITNLSFSSASGALQVLMGPNGSGKSSLALTLMGHPRYEITSGTISFAGTDITMLSPDKRAKLGLFLALQQPPEIPGVNVFTFLKETYHARTGLSVPVSEFKDMVDGLLKKVNLDASFANRSLHEGFSGGEKKRFEVLQLLLYKPRLAILDEIDSGLDVDAMRLIAQAINDFRFQMPDHVTILITHNPRMLSFLEPDRIHILQQGTIITSGDASLIHTLEHKGYDEFVRL